MKLRHGNSEEPQVNLTPLIDVVFLLLIFFMVSTTFTRESEIALELPESSGETLETDEFVIEISIDGQGNYFVNKQQVVNTQLETLKRALREVRADRTDTPQLIISADRVTPHQAVITAMDAARQVGLTSITFATKQLRDEQ
jgi:biopolymer transport protein ExbD